MSAQERSFTFVVAEKPDAARRIASAIGTTVAKQYGPLEYYEVAAAFDGGFYRICSASGHLYGVDDPSRSRRVYPVFDIEWFPTGMLGSKKRRTFSSSGKGYSNKSSVRIQAINSLSKGAIRIIHACDYDIEGETIGFNIIRFMRGKVTNLAPIFRAKFSALTEKDIIGSFSNLESFDSRFSEAGRTRHIIDFFWGVNLSRAISEASRDFSHRFRNLAIGRVQGPTLSFVVHRDREIKTFTPIPYWSLSALLEKDAISFQAIYAKERIDVQSVAKDIHNKISNESSAVIKSKATDTFNVNPPYPFNLGDLQREAFRRFNISPSVTLAIAERLYLQALISYPRTSSQKLPSSINYDRVINSILTQPVYNKFSLQMNERNRRKFPIQGQLDDSAHSAIYPTGVSPSKLSDSGGAKVYDLIVRRFLSCFAEDSICIEVLVDFSIGEYDFKTKALKTLKEGWRSIYHDSDSLDFSLPDLNEGEEVKIASVNLHSKFTEPPKPYTQSSLLQKMGSCKIGTKSTRAETIDTLIHRGLLIEARSRSLSPSNLGAALVDMLERFCKDLVSIELTKKTEEQLENIQIGRESPEGALKQSMSAVSSILKQIHASRIEIGKDLSSCFKASQSVSENRNMMHSIERQQGIFPIGACPICGTGTLRVLRSAKTKKRFIGCSNFSSGCRASAPIPQRGILTRTSEICDICHWPILSVKIFYGRRKTPWRLCPNPSCPTKQKESA